MTDSEQKVLIALVLMVNQYLDEYSDEVDSRSMSAGEHAIEALASYGLMEVVDTRFGRWTEAGNLFRREKVGIRERAQLDPNVGIRLVSKPEAKRMTLCIGGASALGTFETCHPVRIESAFEGKAEVGLRGRQGSFLTPIDANDRTETDIRSATRCTHQNNGPSLGGGAEASRLGIR